MLVGTYQNQLYVPMLFLISGLAASRWVEILCSPSRSRDPLSWCYTSISMSSSDRNVTGTRGSSGPQLAGCAFTSEPLGRGQNSPSVCWAAPAQSAEEDGSKPARTMSKLFCLLSIKEKWLYFTLVNIIPNTCVCVYICMHMCVNIL